MKCKGTMLSPPFKLYSLHESQDIRRTFGHAINACLSHRLQCNNINRFIFLSIQCTYAFNLHIIRTLGIPHGIDGIHGIDGHGCSYADS